LCPDEAKQPGGTPPRRMTPPPVTPPEVQADRRVTFRLRAPNAKEVTVTGGFGAPKALQKDDQGLWSVTVGPLRPDLYGYSFTVDGLRMIDPSNPVVMPAPMINTSVLEVAGDPPVMSKLLDVPHGTVSAWLGSFSAAVFDPETTLTATLPGLQASEGRPRLFWIACGKDDRLLEGSQRLAKLLDEKLIAHTLRESDGGHSWFVWRRYLAEFLPLLFVRPE
jgi:enterochelin esterase family protein